MENLSKHVLDLPRHTFLGCTEMHPDTPAGASMHPDAPRCTDGSIWVHLRFQNVPIVSVLTWHMNWVKNRYLTSQVLSCVCLQWFFRLALLISDGCIDAPVRNTDAPTRCIDAPVSASGCILETYDSWFSVEALTLRSATVSKLQLQLLE